MTIQEIKTKVFTAIDNNRDKIVSIGERIFREPELGFKEFKTANKVKAAFDEIGIEYKDGVAITGVIGTMHGKESKIKVAVMGELDAVIAPNHPYADAKTGAAHSCGHFAQIASMLGVAYALKESGVMSELSGDVAFMAVPAEEAVELEWRNEMIKQGKISFLGGKQEFIRLGEFDDVDIMVMQHTACDGKMTIGGPSAMGFIAKIIEYHGRECHAATPYKGINALDAARIGLTACDAIRTTFKDGDSVRFHYVITKGGNLVNVVPGYVKIEAQVRANSLEALMDASSKLDRALKAGGDALGAKCDINNIPGYLFPVVSKELDKIAESNLRELTDKEIWLAPTQCTTDANDVSNLIPTLHTMICGASGRAHSEDYEITDPESAYITATKFLAAAVVDLLANEAEGALRVKNSYKAPLTKESYLELFDAMKNVK